MVEAIAVTPDSEFAHASLLPRARPKIGIEQACVLPGRSRGLRPRAIALFAADASVRVSDGGGSRQLMSSIGWSNVLSIPGGGVDIPKTRRTDAHFRAALRSPGCLRTGQLLRYRFGRQPFG